jgi:hypothetical protein
MKRKGFCWMARIGVLALASVGALAQTSQIEHFEGTINDYTPAANIAGPWEIGGGWSLDLRDNSRIANFSAALTMVRTDMGVILNGTSTSGGGSLDVPAQRLAHTHHLSLVNGTVTLIPNGFEVTGPITITGNGKYPPPFGTPSTATIDITGGNLVSASNIKITLAGAATTHFGSQPINGVVRSAK